MLDKLIPRKGFLWRLTPGYFKDLLEALDEEPKRIQAFLLQVVTEANPETAVDTQEEWYQQFGLKYNPTKSTAEKQAETKERFVALGAQDITYLQEQVEIAGFDDIALVETELPSGDENNECGEAETGAAVCGGITVANWSYYYVNGTVDNDDETDRLKTLLQKIAPAHLTPIFQVSASDNVCGPAETGEAVCDG